MQSHPSPLLKDRLCLSVVIPCSHFLTPLLLLLVSAFQILLLRAGHVVPHYKQCCWLQARWNPKGEEWEIYSMTGMQSLNTWMQLQYRSESVFAQSRAELAPIMVHILVMKCGDPPRHENAIKPSVIWEWLCCQSLIISVIKSSTEKKLSENVLNVSKTVSSWSQRSAYYTYPKNKNSIERRKMLIWINTHSRCFIFCVLHQTLDLTLRRE